MACYSPLTAYKTAQGDVVFVELKRYDITETLMLPCGQCIGCRLERSRQWATRCMHEASLHKKNAFVTLTFNDQNLPADRSLAYPPYQRFMKRLRKHFAPETVRFYMCGEYGEKLDRPHYHACLFGIDFPDKVFWQKTPSGAMLYRSAILETLWPYGFASVGAVTFESAAYVARYVMKKVNGDAQQAHYEFVDPTSGEITDRRPEFTKMSLKPGLGAGWYTKYKTDVFPHDYVITQGHPSRPPRYYDKLLKKEDPEALDAIKFGRALEGRAHWEDNTPDRLAVREKVAKAKVNLFPRKLK